MIALKCDICGNHFDFGETKYNVIVLRKQDERGGITPGRSYHTCPTCMAAIQNIIENRTRSAEDPFEDDLK